MTAMFDDQEISDSIQEDERERTARAMNYLVEFFLDENKHVRRTRIHHVQSGDEATWENWDQARLLAFFKQRPELRLAKRPQSPKNTQPEQAEEFKAVAIKEESSAAQEVPSSVATDSTETKTSAINSVKNLPRLHKMEIIPKQSGFPCWSFDHNQAFNVRLYLDLAELRFGGSGSLNYSAAVIVKRVGDVRQHKLIENQGVIAIDGEPALNLKWPALPPGLYKISAAVTIRPTDAGPASPEEFTSSLDGGQFRLY